MKLSIFLPSIRVHLLPRLAESIDRSLMTYLQSEMHPSQFERDFDWELVVAGPFELPEGLENYDVKWIKTYQSPTCAAQEAALHCTGDWILHTVDDAVYLPGQLHRLMSLVNAVSLERNIYNAKYLECATTFKKYIETDQVDLSVGPPNNYWYVNNNYPGLPIDPGWGITCHFLMPKSAFVEYGGFDCNFEYLNHACHDLLFRMYRDNWSFVDFHYCSLADWIPGITGDHKPINDAQLQHDGKYFYDKWSQEVPIVIDPYNYEMQPKIWDRRFGKKEINTYEELGYK